MLPFLKGMDYHKHFLVIYLIVAFHVHEALGHESYWVEFSVGLELGQDRTGRKVGGIAFEFEMARIGGEGEDRGRSDGFLKGKERSVFVWSPGPCFRLPS